MRDLEAGPQAEGSASANTSTGTSVSTSLGGFFKEVSKERQE
jgi:hypothetical protein